MARTLIQALQKILADGCRDKIATENLSDDDLQLGHLINQILARHDQEKSNRLAMKADLLDDIDSLAVVLEKIALGGFEVKSPPMRLAEMDTVQIGIQDMTRKLQKNMGEIIQSEQQVRKMERKYRHIFEDAIEGLFQIDTDGLFLTANPSCCRLLGYACCDELKQGASPYLPQCFAFAEDKTNYESILQGKSQISDFTTRLKRKGGETFWAKISLRAVYGKNKQLKFYEGYLLDVTESKVKEQAEKERRIAEESSKAKSLFLANMSHEIRTPLNAIIGFNRLILEKQLPSPLQQYLGNAQESAELLLVLINDILDFSKIEAGQLDLTDELFDLRVIVDGVMKTMVGKAEEKGIDLHNHMDGEFCTSLLGDGYRLRQILLNLMGNSLKFTEQGGVSLHTEMYAESADAIVLHFQVRDTGPGIPLEARERIFESFSQADNSISRVHGGSGLGLAISKRLVGLLGGEIWVTSELGQGATFHFTAKFGKGSPEAMLGAAEFPAQQSVELSDGMAAHGEMLLDILLVEDNKFNVDLAQIMLESAGHQVTVALNGLQALKALREKRFDVVLMDVQMPEMDGIVATRLIRSCETDQGDCPPEYQELVKGLGAKLKGRRLPIIAMTANSMSGDRENYLAAGMDDYISKPYYPDEISATLQRVVTRQAPSDALVV